MIRLKAGTYYVGDPCYIFDKSWTELLDETEFFKKEPCEIKGKLCFINNTAYGDGLYVDNKDRYYVVDSGIIGVLPISLINIDNVLTKEEIMKDNGMHVIKFEKDFDCYYTNGTFHIGSIIIETGDKE